MELFAKPDDFWEVNNVAPRCQEVVECLGDALTEFEQTFRPGELPIFRPCTTYWSRGWIERG